MAPLPVESVGPWAEHLEQWSGGPGAAPDLEAEALPRGLLPPTVVRAVAPWARDPRIRALPPPAPDPRRRALTAADISPRDRARMREVVPDPSGRAQGRIREIVPESDPRKREIPRAEGLIQLPELDVRSFGALGIRLRATGSIEAGSRFLRIRVEGDLPSPEDDPFQVERVGKPGRRDKPIKADVRPSETLLDFLKWRVGAWLGVSAAGTARGDGGYHSLRGKIVQIDEPARMLILDRPAVRTVVEAEVWNDDAPGIQAALGEAGRLAADPLVAAAVVRIPRGLYPIGVPWAADNQPLRIMSKTDVVGEGPARTVLALADEVNQILDRTKGRAEQAVAATLMTNWASGLYTFSLGRAGLGRADHHLTVRGLTLDGNRDHQSLLHTVGGLAAIWRQPPLANAPEMVELSRWIDVGKLVRWGSGERSVEAVARPGKGRKASLFVAVSLVSPLTGEESTAAVAAAAVVTAGPFAVVMHHLPTNRYLDAQHPPTLKVYVAWDDGAPNSNLDGSRYRLLRVIPGIKAGDAHECDAGAAGTLTPAQMNNPERPPGLLSLEGVRRVNPKAGTGAVAAVGLHLDNVQDFVVEDVEIRDFAGGAIYFGSQAEGEARRGVLRRVDLHGYRWFALALVYRVFDLTLEDCTIWDSDYGMDVENVQQVEGLTLRRCGILECAAKGLQLVPLTGPGEFIENVRLLGCALVGNGVHVIVGNEHTSYWKPGLLRGLTIDEDDQAPHRPGLFAWGRSRVLFVRGGVAGGRLAHSVLRWNGFPKVGLDAGLGMPQFDEFRRPRGPYYDAAADKDAGINESLVCFEPFLRDQGPMIQGKAPVLARGPSKWVIEMNEIQANRLGKPPPENDHGIVEIGWGLEGFTVQKNTIGPAVPVRGQVFVAVWGPPRPTVVVAGNSGPRTMDDWQLYFPQFPNAKERRGF